MCCLFLRAINLIIPLFHSSVAICMWDSSKSAVVFQQVLLFLLSFRTIPFEVTSQRGTDVNLETSLPETLSHQSIVTLRPVGFLLLCRVCQMPRSLHPQKFARHFLMTYARANRTSGDREITGRKTYLRFRSTFYGIFTTEAAACTKFSP